MAKGIAALIHKNLLKNNLTVAVAESCTGGLVSKLLTDLSGSSQYFLLGIVSYSNRAKSDILKIPASIVAKSGAVSEKVAVLMAKRVRSLAKADLAVSVTGIAGPSGGSEHKPVGTVYICACGKNKVTCKRFQFSGRRGVVRKKSAQKCLELLKCALLSP